MDEYANFIFFSFVLMRMSGFVLLNPIFARKNVPGMVKTGLTIALTVIVYAAVEPKVILPNTFLEYGILLLKEFSIGYVVGFVISLFSMVVIFAGDFIDMQQGMSMSKVFDAQSNSSLSLSSTYYNILYMLLFFTMDAHIALIHILITSYEVVPFGQVVFSQELAKSILDIFSLCIVFAIKFSFPIVAIEFLSSMGMGILMKTIPQINVFVVDIQLKIFVGMTMMVLLFTPMAGFLQNLVTILIEHIEGIFHLMV